MPVMASSTSVVMGRPRSGQGVPRLVHGRLHGGAVERGGAGDGDRTGLEDHVDALDLGYLLRDRGDAVAAGHAGDGPGAHVSHRGFLSRGAQERTSREIAST